MKQIIVTTDFVGYHCYNDAPDEVSFLKERHRHKFFVKLGIEVFNNDRELEFFIVQKALKYEIGDERDIESCETFAEEILNWTMKKYGDNRNIFVEVWEDNENGVRIEKIKEVKNDNKS